MRNFGVKLRNQLPALGLGLMVGMGMTVGAAATMTPAAYAQKQVKSSPEFGKPMNEAQALVNAKDWNGALAKVEQAAPHAKSPQEKLAVEQFRAVVYANTRNNAKLITSLEAQLATGLLDANTIKNYKNSLAGLYDQTGNSAKAIQLTKEYLNTYGMDADKAIYVASKALGAKDYAGAIEWGNKAIDAKRRAGATPAEKWYAVVLKAQYESSGADKSGYYSTLERMVVDHPKDEYWRELIRRAEKEPKFNRNGMQLDVFRALVGAKVDLTPGEQAEMAEYALIRLLPAEAASLLEPTLASGKIEASKVDRLKRMLEDAKKKAESEKGELAAQANEASAQASGVALTNVAEVYMTHGDYSKAIELFQKGIAKGQMDAAALDTAKLRLGIAQMKAGQKEAARKTWSEVKSDNGSAILARMWTNASRL
ncbi:tetratricopeptide repeat protein [bacterium]|nr:tetratricopeptide repeat protein [bacterium]